MTNEPSRLLNGNIYYNGAYISIEKYRNIIMSHSLYSLDNEYKSNNVFSLKNESDVVNGISSILNVIPQYNRMQFNTNILSNTYDAFNDNSPLARIGLVMLGKQVAYNVASKTATKLLPSINLNNLFNNNKVFNKNIDNSITVKDETGLNKLVTDSGNLVGVYDKFGNANPFNNSSDNIERIRNTGDGQLTNFLKAINLNIYKPINSKNKEIIGKIGDIKTQKQTAFSKTFFIIDPNFFNKSIINSESVNQANNMMVESYSSEQDDQEYGLNYNNVTDDFGLTIKKDNKGLEEWVNDDKNFSNDAKIDKLIWGRNNISDTTRAENKLLRGDFDEDNADAGYIDLQPRVGLLNYTNNLLNATEGKLIDITRKAFYGDNDKDVIGFQGSPLWKANDSKYAELSDTKGKTGVRQHTILDPYDRVAKAIRFKGNIVYNGKSNGNVDSVAYKTVLPRIHPTKDGDTIDNKNLMFSLENLAIGTIKRDDFGVIDDEYGSQIPLSEVGPFNGRIMWFPPYNIEFNEVSVAKYESTVMVGRNEPMYNYMNSERTATLNFTLIVDYPEQLRNLKGDNKNKDIANFFAFGGDPLPIEAKKYNLEEEITILKNKIIEIEKPVKLADPTLVSNIPTVLIYFQNDMPNTGNINTVITEMYNNPNHYEIIDGCLSAQDGNGFGYNKDIFVAKNLIDNIDPINQQDKYLLNSTLPSFDQYNATGLTGDFNSECVLNKNLFDMFKDADNIKYYKITITGTASKLYLTDNEKEYNEKLGDRRVKAAKHLIISRLNKMFGSEITSKIENNITLVPSKGSLNRSDKGKYENNMNLPVVKSDRVATISFGRSDVSVDDKKQELTEKQKTNIKEIENEIQNKETALLKLNKVTENVFKERDSENANLNGFESISGNYYSATFHSQTPEDFHRRLTFLQQCMRQGSAKTYDIVDSNNELRARNSVFGRQPICILRVGDFFYTKVIIENINIDYNDTIWDTNPEGFGVQPMIANVTLQMKLIGGQSLKGPIDALQNAVSFNYYANSTFTDNGMYSLPSDVAKAQNQHNFGVDGIGGTINKKRNNLITAYDKIINKDGGNE